jgi:hypothetical protein
VTDPVKSGSPAVWPWTVPVLCVPCLLGFALFICSFPIDRKISFWPRLSLAELYIRWFLFVAPISTLIALIVLIRRRVEKVKILAWVLVIASIVVNLLVLLGFQG